MRIVVFMIIFLMGINLVNGEKLGTLKELINPYTITIAKGRLYVVEGTSIYIYSLNDLRLENKFGKKGEGPGEFTVPPRTNMGNVSINVLSDSIAVTSLSKLSFYTLNGKFKKEIRAIFPWPSFAPVGDKFVGRGSTSQDGLRYYTVKIFNKEFTTSRKFCQTQSWYNPGREIRPFFMIGPQYYIIGNKIYVEKDKDEVQVFDSSGKFLSSININQGYQKIKVTTADREKYLEYYKTEPAFKQMYDVIKRDIKFPKYFPGIRFFYVAGGEIYIIRWTGTEDKLDMAIFSSKGGLLRNGRISIFMKDAIAPYAFGFADKKMYQLVEDEESEGVWNLHAMTINQI